jgi:hypothetical protein
MSQPLPPDAPAPDAPSAGSATNTAVQQPGTIEVSHEHATVEAEVEESGPVGVRLKRLKVSTTPADPVDLHRRARHIADRVRPGGERLHAVEVDPTLGGGQLRTHPTDIRRGRYFQVDISGDGDAEVRRYAVDARTGDRTEDAFDLTRRQLEELVDGLAQIPDPVD